MLVFKDIRVITVINHYGKNNINHSENRWTLFLNFIYRF